MPAVFPRTPENKRAMSYGYTNFLKDLVNKHSSRQKAQTERMLSDQMTDDDVLELGLSGVGGLIRYRGRKLREALTFAKKMPPVQGTLRELFGGSLVLSREIFGAGKAKNIIIGEKSPYMRNLYKQIRDRPEEVASLTGKLFKARDSLPADEAVAFTKAFMQKLKEGGLSKTEQAAGDIFIGQRSYSYSPREIPWMGPGKYASSESTRAKIFATSAMLKKAKIKTNWQEVLQGAKAEDILLVDPPYHGTRGYKATGKFDSEPLSAALRQTKAKGILWSGEAGLSQFPWATFKRTKPTEFAAGLGTNELLDLLKVKTKATRLGKKKAK